MHTPLWRFLKQVFSVISEKGQRMKVRCLRTAEAISVLLNLKSILHVLFDLKVNRDP